MSRILLVDDSPHAQRMGERILSDEGYEVVTVSNSDSALIRLDDVDPDVVLADTVMPGRTGFEICQYLKMSPRHRHVRVILTAGVLEAMDEAQVRRVEADGTLRKPFEASALLTAVKPLAEAAAAARAEAASLEPGAKGKGPGSQAKPAAVPFVAVVDAEQVRAAVTVALDATMAAIVDEITDRVLAALNTKKSANPTPETAPARPQPPIPAPPPPALPMATSRVEPVRRSNPMKIRSTSILGLELDLPKQESPASEVRTVRAVSRTDEIRPAPEIRAASGGPLSKAFSLRSIKEARMAGHGSEPPGLGSRPDLDTGSASQPPSHSNSGELSRSGERSGELSRSGEPDSPSSD